VALGLTFHWLRGVGGGELLVRHEHLLVLLLLLLLRGARRAQGSDPALRVNPWIKMRPLIGTEEWGATSRGDRASEEIGHVPREVEGSS
jgi:hypothetical protein